MTEHMDQVDQKQQIEITRLQEENKSQDRIFKLGVAGIILVIILFTLTIAMLAKREVYCPHSECPHFIGAQ